MPQRNTWNYFPFDFLFNLYFEPFLLSQITGKISKPKQLMLNLFIQLWFATFFASFDFEILPDSFFVLSRCVQIIKNILVTTLSYHVNLYLWNLVGSICHTQPYYYTTYYFAYSTNNRQCFRKLCRAHYELKFRCLLFV